MSPLASFEFLICQSNLFFGRRRVHHEAARDRQPCVHGAAERLPHCSSSVRQPCDRWFHLAHRLYCPSAKRRIPTKNLFGIRTEFPDSRFARASFHGHLGGGRTLEL